MVDAKLVSSNDKKHLVLVMKGKAAGETYCRAGTGLGPTVLVHVTVVEPEPLTLAQPRPGASSTLVVAQGKASSRATGMGSPVTSLRP